MPHPISGDTQIQGMPKLTQMWGASWPAVLLSPSDRIAEQTLVLPDLSSRFPKLTACWRISGHARADLMSSNLFCGVHSLCCNDRLASMLGESSSPVAVRQSAAKCVISQTSNYIYIYISRPWAALAIISSICSFSDIQNIAPNPLKGKDQNPYPECLRRVTQTPSLLPLPTSTTQFRVFR